MSTPDLSMRLDEHRIPDGTRPLELGRAVKSIHPSYVDPQRGRELECFNVRHAGRYGLPVPLVCRRRIVRGDHFLLWTEYDLDDRPTGLSVAYCAPCAVADWVCYGVRESTP